METPLAEIWAAMVSWPQYLPADFDCGFRLICGSPSREDLVGPMPTVPWNMGPTQTVSAGV